MVAFPHCKINLGLRIVDKREDGFHNIETCFYPIPWCDVLEVIPSSTFSFNSTGISIPGDKENNLCVKAYHAMKKKFDLPPVAIHLHKVVPMGAGLGGGSSDAAFTLKILNELFSLNLSAQELTLEATKLGSDCSFFLFQSAMMGTGRGDELSPMNISLAGKFGVIIKPEVHVSTAEAYKNIKPGISDTSIKEILETSEVKNWKMLLFNDFEASVFGRYPSIKKAKESLYEAGALYACMSGSGSSVFGLFSAPVDLKKRFEGLVYWSGNL